MDLGRQERTGLFREFLRRLTGRSPGRPDAVSGNRCLAVAPEVGASTHEDGLALLHIPTGRVFVCNRTGSWIWQGVVSGLSADAISDKISRESGVAYELVERHTSSFLTELERRGLVTRRMDA